MYEIKQAWKMLEVMQDATLFEKYLKLWQHAWKVFETGLGHGFRSVYVPGRPAQRRHY